MVGENAFGDTLGGLFSGSLSTIVISFAVLFIFLLVVGFAYYFGVYRKKFDITVKIISERSEDPSIFFDKAAILEDKKEKIKFLRLQKLRYDLEIPPFKIFQKTSDGDYIELKRKSEDGFVFLTPPKISKKYFIKKDGKVYRFDGQAQREIESDIYWTLTRKQKNNSIISPESILMKLLQYTPHIITLAITFMMLWIILKQLPIVIDAISRAADVISQANPPTVVGSYIGFLKWKKQN